MTVAPPAWGSRRKAGKPWSRPPDHVPRIVAESLVDVADPLDTALDPGPTLPPDIVARSLARSVAPPEANVPAPHWLRPDQVTQFRRVVAALRGHGGALLADPVGSGKSWIALAAGGVLAPGGVIAVVAPAILRLQWSALGARLGIPIDFVSHETVSRGSLPRPDARFLVLDESHRFRTPTTRRYLCLAPWMVGRIGLLLSATPVVNRLEDLAHQLLLVLRDDALVTRGCPSLRTSLVSGSPTPALGEVVLQREAADGLPSVHHRSIRPPASPSSAHLLRAIETLALSREAGTSALLRMTFYRALASSPAALAATLRRYLRLLDHAAAAAAAGRIVSRATIRSLTSGDPDQCLMWELLGGDDDRLELETCERDLALAALQAAEGDLAARCAAGRIAPLRALLADGIPSVVFTASRDTLGWLRRELRVMVPAWITGVEAGIGAARLSREAVLGWFMPGAKAPAGLRVPHVLLATDVAAEGLNLQRARRVVHFDLPWTDVRLRQRAGRARRLGSDVTVVEIVTVLPAATVERRIRQLERLRHKRELARSAGLDQRAPWLFRWRAGLSAWAGSGETPQGHAVVRGHDPGWLVGLALVPVGEAAGPATLLWFGEDGRDDDQPAEVVPRLLQVPEAESSSEDLAWDRLRPRLVAAARALLARTAGAAWSDGDGRPGWHRLLHRLRALARRAAIRRDLPALQRIERALGAIGGGLSAGEALLVERAARAEDDDLLSLLRAIPARDRPAPPLRAVMTGIVRVTSFPPCAASTPSCSTSMAPSSTRSS